MEEILVIRSIDPYIAENGKDHHTNKYEVMGRDYYPQLVVRRGQPFRLILNLSRSYNPYRDSISFIFTIDDEEKTSYGQRTLVAVPLLLNADNNFFWNVLIYSETEDSLIVDVITDSNSVVGKWKLEVDTKITDKGAYCYCWETSIYLLFNPWCKNDLVFLKNEDWREEAVLNDTGIIWRGTYNRTRSVIWKYDQFETDILDCSLYVLLEVGKVKGKSRSDPIQVSRVLAAAVNSADDDGVVMGNWTEDHSGGTAPTEWLGSKDILQRYYKKQKPVKYGQCWVFSGVLTTICRALGIPARSVTNYASAHDTQDSLTVDYFMDERGKIIEELNSDSVWNFHVWNEVWMSRPDLGENYGGWQALDSTPQVLSDNVYRVGPSSVAAIREGEVLRPYDGGFVFAEVNADKIFWRYTSPTKPLKLLRKDTKGIGKLICTKSPNSFLQEDITHTYKYPEKTAKERYTMLTALQQSKNAFARYYLNEEFNDLHFEFNFEDDVKIGQAFKVSLLMININKKKEYNVLATLRVDTVNYRGDLGALVQKRDFVLVVKENTIFELGLDITYNQYARKIIDQGAFCVSCFAKIKNTKHEYYAQDDFRVRKPDIKIDVSEEVVENKEISVKLYLQNPLPVAINRGYFTVEAPGYETPLKIKTKYPVYSGQEVKGEFKYIPVKSGEQTIAAKFTSKELSDCDGFKIINVKHNLYSDEEEQ